MLVSHRYKFIFLKTMKTAGTSVESYFEQYCMKEGEWTQQHQRDEYISESGIIGYRGGNKGEAKFYNHMPASELKQILGDGIWNNYFKFSVIRCPFEKVVSAFYWSRKITKQETLFQSPEDEIAAFQQWFKKTDGVRDRHTFMIDDKPAPDFFIRHERLSEDIQTVCTKLALPFEPELIPTFKAGVTNNSIPVADFYNAELIEKVNRLFFFEISSFGYASLPN